MKKITMMMFALGAIFTIQGQELTQFQGNVDFTNSSSQNLESEIILSQTQGAISGGVSCTADVGDGGSDNYFFRAYELSAYGVIGDVEIVGLEFIPSDTEAMEITIMAWDFVGFPGNFDITNMPPPIAIGTVNVTSANQGQIVRAEFDTPAIGNEDSNIVIAVVQLDETFPFYLAVGETATKPTWLASEGCDITQPLAMADLGFPDAHHIINLIYNESLSVGDNLSENISVYPNPTSGVFNISIPSNVEVLKSSLVDVLGKTTGVVYGNGQMNVAALSPGIYFMKLETNLGTYNKKVVVRK